MELLALVALALATAVGWLICTTLLAHTLRADQRLYFAPAIGFAVCGVIAYVAVKSHMPWVIRAFTAVSLVAAVVAFWRRPRVSGLSGDPSRLARFTVFVLLCGYGMQIALYALFSRIHPGTDEIWNVFNLSGVSPPDQMFAWHQAMFFAQHRVYPQAPFYEAMDFYDRPQLGGCITLFFFQLFHLPLAEKQFTYPAAALHFYHCLWWLLNSLYLFGVAPLFRQLFGLRGAVFAVASTAVGGFFILCNVGAWMKFSSAYPFLLAFLLFLEGRGPVLQALLCAVSYYIHGSVLPFLAGFGALQIFSLRYPLTPRLPSFRSVALFSSVGVVVVGAWFVAVRWVGSKQLLFYYYIYDAGLTEAQTRPVAEIARDFYAHHAWGSLVWLPIHNLASSLFPILLYDFVRGALWFNAAARVSNFASAVFEAQRFCLECALGIVAAPFAIAAGIKALALRHAGKIALCLYLIPTLMIALIYRREWAFSLHVMCLYHTLILFLWVSMFRRVRLRHATVALSAIALEGVVCVLFADDRFLPVTGLRLSDLQASQWACLAVYLALTLCIVAAGVRELKHAPKHDNGFVRPQELSVLQSTGSAAIKCGAAVLITTAVIGAYALYCRRYY